MRCSSCGAPDDQGCYKGCLDTYNKDWDKKQDLITRTSRLLNDSEYTYEDFAHSARHLLEEWLNAS